MHHHHQPHPATPAAAADYAAAFRPNQGKKRGSYNCGRCGQPKKGHVCHLPPPSSAADVTDCTSAAASPVSVPCLPRQQYTQPRRVLSFDDMEVVESEGEVGDDDDDDEEEEVETTEIGSGKLPASCLWEVMKRLAPQELLEAAKVCRGWRDASKRIWKATEELRLRVPVKSRLGFAGSVLKKCPGLLRLTLRMESDVDATMLACIAFLCPNLQSLEIFTSHNSVNRITGDELGRFVADKRSLSCLKMEGCCNLGGFNIFSSSLSTLWLSNLHSLTKMVFNCPNLKEISLDFSRQENECTDLTTMVEGLGRSCPRLQNIHISSIRLSHAVVLSLTAANLRGLRMLSLVLGTEITDASVAAIASSYSNLELLDLSGSSISDSGIGMICNVFPDTLSRLLLAVCPNISSSGIQFATAQLPLLELMDCGMTICDLNDQDLTSEEDDNSESQKTANSTLHLMYQKLIIKHGQLKKLSLWGCSGLDALYLNCPELIDLNLNSCKNLHSESVLLQCPRLENLHASGCQKMLIQTIQNQVCYDSGASENRLPLKRLADGSKRVQVPHFLYQQRRRVHLTLELPWSADRAIQQFGRTHRSNQASAPEYRLLFSNLGGERRFASIVARRLESLGALTQGDRRAGPSLSAYNYDSAYGKRALMRLYTGIMEQDSLPVLPPGCSTENPDTVQDFIVKGKNALVSVGIVREAISGNEDPENFYGGFIDDADMHDVGRFLNRLLGLPPEIQNLLFELFVSILDLLVQNARIEGHFDPGIADIKAKSIALKGPPKIVHIDRLSGASTVLNTFMLDRGFTWEAATMLLMEKQKEVSASSSNGFYESKREWLGRRHYLLAYEGYRRMYKIVRPAVGEAFREMPLSELQEKYRKVSALENARTHWENEYHVSSKQCMHGPKCKHGDSCTTGRRLQEVYILCGLILPVWRTIEKALSNQSRERLRRLRVVRIETTTDSRRVVGLLIPNAVVDLVLESLG